MEERVYLSMLLGVYGSLLTDKQRDIMKLYYDDDLSLSEISELTTTTRQAIYDIIRRCHKTLIGYEKNLQLLSKYDKSENLKKSIKEDLAKVKCKIEDDKILNIINDIENKLEQI
ncbi:DNA-binding protein [Clostridium sp. DMHC 10]|uniref:putative DNA-binding protein n=1 Tax=Clostridium sp. DMHC 10 TaxID=747377 RepID=UPI00069F0623|nr:putative DNA-binding protein [Clostridium sp. DMHC 10]KOF58139.1 DNA-binding protein [Clostridium sp. DMHC 10]